MDPRRSLQTSATVGTAVGRRAPNRTNGGRGCLRDADDDPPAAFAGELDVRAPVPPGGRSFVAIGNRDGFEIGRAVDPPL